MIVHTCNYIINGNEVSLPYVFFIYRQVDRQRDHLSRTSPQVLDGQEGGERGAIEKVLDGVI